MLSNLYRMVHSILSREGVDATLLQQGSTGVYNPATGAYTPATPATNTIRVALIDFGNITNGLTTHNGTLIEGGDKQAYADGHNLTTKISPAGDTLTIGTTTWRIISVREYNTTGSYSILYDLLLRK